jgi:hypothetical protein
MDHQAGKGPCEERDNDGEHLSTSPPLRSLRPRGVEASPNFIGNCGAHPEKARPVALTVTKHAAGQACYKNQHQQSLTRLISGQQLSLRAHVT